jgi:hypothetical protein
LVEAVEPSITVTERSRAVRVLLGDGHLCIQALLRSEIHSFVDAGQVYAGCYVKLGRFALCVVDRRNARREDAGDGGQGNFGVREGIKERARDPEMVYLLVDDITTVGRDNAYMQILAAHTNGVEGTNRGRESTHTALNAVSIQDEECGERLGIEPTPPVKFTEATCEDGRHSEATEHERRLPCAEDAPGSDAEEISDFEDAFEVMEVSEQSATQRRLNVERNEPIRSSSNPEPKVVDSIPSRTSYDLLKPMKLTPLRSIPNLPYRQNWMVNVLAIVASLSGVEPSHLPPYSQRTARLADPTTSKHVLLTVFLDPEEFNPGVGNVVLLVGVKNHGFDGGSLRKYVSDRPKEGTRWWFEEPRNVEWCDVTGLKRWWDGRHNCPSRVD